MTTLTTPRLAIPYPDGTERVRDGDNAMGAIATTLDDLAKTGIPFRMQAGIATVTISSAASGNAAVTYTRFTQPPIVIATAVVASTAYFAIVSAGPTVSGFTASAVHRDGTVASATVPIHWIAVQMLTTAGAG